MEFKFGKPVTVYDKYTGVVLKVNEESNTALVSFYAEGVNMKSDIPLDEIKQGGTVQEASTKGQYIEEEDAGCEGGACKI